MIHKIKNNLQKILFIVSAASISSMQAQAETQQNEQTNIDANQIHHFISTLALVKHYYLEDVSTDKLIENAIQGMISKLDPHSSFLTEKYFQQMKSDINGEFGGIGVEITEENGLLKVISPIDGTPAHKAGMKPQDLIIKINGLLVKDISTMDAISKIRGKIGTKVKLTVLRKGEKQPLTLSIMRDIIKIHSIKHELLDQNYGYIKLLTFQNDGKEAMLNAITDLQSQANSPLKGLILDLRNNPGGLLHIAVDISDLFLDADDMKHNNLIVYTKGKHPESNIKLSATTGEILEQVPIVVLMNQGSASASEIVAGALQDHKRAIVVGNKSFGKGSVQTIIPTFSGDGAVKLTTALYYTPKGRTIQARGITPDLLVTDIKLPDNKTEALAFVPLAETDLQGHLANTTPEAQNNAPKSNIALAKKDYQLYQALNILKGMAILKKNHFAP